MGKTKVPKLLAVSMPFNGMQTASYCNNTLQRTANVTSHRCNNSCDVQVYHELLQGQTYCMPMSHSLTRCRLTSGPNSRMRRFIVSKEARARRSSVGLKKACIVRCSDSGFSLKKYFYSIVEGSYSTKLCN